ATSFSPLPSSAVRLAEPGTEHLLKPRRRAPAERREHDVREMGMRLTRMNVPRPDAERDHHDLELVEDLVEEQALGIDRQTEQLVVACDERVAGLKPADEPRAVLVDRAVQAREHPAEILVAVAQARELPVENRRDRVRLRIEQEVAAPVVAVDERDALGR